MEVDAGRLVHSRHAPRSSDPARLTEPFRCPTTVPSEHRTRPGSPNGSDESGGPCRSRLRFRLRCRGRSVYCHHSLKLCPEVLPVSSASYGQPSLESATNSLSLIHISEPTRPY